MSLKAIRAKRMTLVQRVNRLEDSMRDEVNGILRNLVLAVGLLDDKVVALEMEVAALKAKDNTAERLAAAGLVAPVPGMMN